jgi:hypothetical protein
LIQAACITATCVLEGTITSFDVTGAGTGSGDGTEPAGIDATGVVVGEYVDASGVNHGFQRSAGGVITTGSVPGAGTGSSQGTFPETVSSSGAIAGYYVDANGVNHGFVLTP